MRFKSIPTLSTPIRILQILCIINALWVPICAFACTSFCLNENDKPMVGANFDWPLGDGMIVINKRGFRKTAMTDPQKHLNPVSWRSHYGSVTFNFLGIDWPWGGMNEAGLVITSLQLAETVYPSEDERPSIHRGQWVQYQLDNFSSVDQVIQNADRLRIRNIDNGYGAHYLVVDQHGNCAVIEFLKGRCIFYIEEKMPIKVLTNDPYARSLDNTKRFNGFGGPQKIPEGNVSYCRFLKAASMLNNNRPRYGMSTIDAAFDVLHRVRYQNHPRTHSQWSMVYDTHSRMIVFKTLNNPTRRRIDLNHLDFSCMRPVHTADIHSTIGRNDIDAFSEYTVEINRAGFRHAFPDNPMTARINRRRLDRIARYPETFVCQDK